MSKRHTFSSSDDRLNEFLRNKQNKSAFVEAAVRQRMWESEEMELTQSQQKALDWLRMRVGDGLIGLETAKNRIAQLTNKSKELVMQDIIKPMEKKGIIEVVTGVKTVLIGVRK